MVEPYYSDEWVTLYHGDCREILPTIVGHALVTDPPYGGGVQYGATFDDSDSEWIPGFLNNAVENFECALITPGIGRAFSYTQPRWMLAWLKPGSMRRQTLNGFNVWEPVLVYGNQSGRVIHDTFSVPTISNVYSGETGDHPCPKPLSLMRWLVQIAAPQYAIVVDPFAGSGTTLRATVDTGRHAVGIEIEERYCEIAAKRLAQDVLDFESA